MSIDHVGMANIPFDPESTPKLNPTVRGVQQALNQLAGTVLREDGIFDAPTSQAIRQFQQAQNLEVTGAINRPTIEALNRLSSPLPAASSAAPAGSEGTVLGAQERFQEKNLEGLVLRSQLEKILDEHLAGAGSGAGPGAAGEGQMLPAIQRDSLMGDGSVRFHPAGVTVTRGLEDDLGNQPAAADQLLPGVQRDPSMGDGSVRFRSSEVTIMSGPADDLKEIPAAGRNPNLGSSQNTVTLPVADDLNEVSTAGRNLSPGSLQNTVTLPVADDLNQLTLTIRAEDDLQGRG